MLSMLDVVEDIEMSDLRIGFQILQFILHTEWHDRLLKARHPFRAVARAEDFAQVGGQCFLGENAILARRVFLDPVWTLDGPAKTLEELVEH